MAAPTSRRPNDLQFRPFLPWFLAKNALALGASAYFVGLALRSGQRWWLIGAALALCLDLLLVCHYQAQLITLHGFTLICRRGVLRVRENSVPLAHIDLEIEQSLLGRVFKYGTVRFVAGSDTVLLRQVALVGELRSAVARRQNAIVLLLMNRPTSPSGQTRNRAA